MLLHIFKKNIVLAICYLLIFGYILIQSPIAKADQNLSLSFDMLAPAISQPEYKDVVTEGNDHMVTVNVTDNAIINQVILYYRVIGAEKFIQLPMKPIKDTDNYQVNIAAEHIKKSGIEYYIKAIDSSENESFHGHNFSPLSVTVITDTPVEPIPPSTLASNVALPEESSIFTNKWFWIGVGVLVVGAAAGGGSGGGASGATTGTLTIDAGELIIP